MVLCSLVDKYQWIRGSAIYILRGTDSFSTENESRRLLWNIDTYLLNYTESHRRTLYSLYWSRELQISPVQIIQALTPLDKVLRQLSISVITWINRIICFGVLKSLYFFNNMVTIKDPQICHRHTHRTPSICQSGRQLIFNLMRLLHTYCLCLSEHHTVLRTTVCPNGSMDWKTEKHFSHISTYYNKSILNDIKPTNKEKSTVKVMLELVTKYFVSELSAIKQIHIWSPNARDYTMLFYHTTQWNICWETIY